MNLSADAIEVTVNDAKLRVYRNGDVFRLMKHGDWRLVPNTPNSATGYNQVGCGDSKYYRHRIIAYAYLNLDINDIIKHIDHINGDKICNHVDNLRIVTNQENQHNRKNVKGYYWYKARGKWRASIGLNGKTIDLGYYDTEADARSAYLAGKLIYHPTAPIYNEVV